VSFSAIFLVGHELAYYKYKLKLIPESSRKIYNDTEASRMLQKVCSNYLTERNSQLKLAATLV